MTGSSGWAWSSEMERMKGAAAFGGGFVWSSPKLEARLVVILWFEAAVWRKGWWRLVVGLVVLRWLKVCLVAGCEVG
ncbi:hypothetical protein KY284_010731 [Solanum tuberosum]|nr:hypothetical protein KY284_010731 [Solanum tuberosum]